MRAYRTKQPDGRPKPNDVAPYPDDYPYKKPGLEGLFCDQNKKRRREEYGEKHTGGLGEAGVDEITLAGDNRTLSLGGMEHNCDPDGKLRILDCEFWGRSLRSYEKRLKYLQHIAKVIGMSSDAAMACLGNDFAEAWPADVEDYKGDEIPLAMRVDCTPDIVRCYPKRSPEFSKAYAKQIFLLERTAVAFSGDIEEFMGDTHHSEETGKELKHAVE